jgi:hypothetical protein
MKRNRLRASQCRDTTNRCNEETEWGRDNEETQGTDVMEKQNESDSKKMQGTSVMTRQNEGHESNEHNKNKALVRERDWINTVQCGEETNKDLRVKRNKVGRIG